MDDMAILPYKVKAGKTGQAPCPIELSEVLDGERRPIEP
jgi:hypothetical protein